MWIAPPLLCLMGIVVALLPPAEPIEDVHIGVRADKPPKTNGVRAPMALATMVTLAVLALALHAVLAA